MNGPTRLFRARSTMMLAVICWFARVGERIGAAWRRVRDRFSRSRGARGDLPVAKVANAHVEGSLKGSRHVTTHLRVTEVFVARRSHHANHSS